MIEDCENKGYKKPKWTTNAEYTTVTFPDVTVTTKEDDAVNDAVNDAVRKGLIDAVSATVHDALIDTVKTIINQKEGAVINDIMRATGKSNATVKRYLQILRDLKLVEFRGATKTGKYYLTAETAKKLNTTKSIE